MRVSEKNSGQDDHRVARRFSSRYLVYSFTSKTKPTKISPTYFDGNQAGRVNVGDQFHLGENVI
jgi:hypothetical protein